MLMLGEAAFAGSPTSLAAGSCGFGARPYRDHP
jgi:hypothetical protein